MTLPIDKTLIPRHPWFTFAAGGILAFLIVLLLAAVSLLLTGCTSRGELGGECNPDGSCNSPTLRCVAGMNGFGGPAWFCVLKPEDKRP